MNSSRAKPASPVPNPTDLPGKSVGKGRVTHASAVRIAIENDIFAGVLFPGTPIDEDALMERFAVSRTPVREAMLQLLQANLIEKQPRRPATVARLDLPRLIHAFEAVSELEALCTGFAASRMTNRERDALVELHDQCSAELVAGNVENYARLGRRFHMMLIEATHNSVLIETTSKLALHTLPYRRFQLRQKGRSEANQHDHDAILAAVLAGDGATASEIMRRHVTVQGDVLAAYISMGQDQL